MQANDAMRILGSAAAMGLLGGGGALAYNATTKPILDEYGNVIESNDINPVMAALGSAAIGAVGGGIYGKMNQPIARPVQGMSTGTSSQPQQSPDIDIDVTPSNPKGWNYVDPDPDEVYYQAAKRNYEKGLLPMSQQDEYYHDLVAKNVQKEIDNLRNEIAITRQGIDEYKKNRKVPEARQPQPQQSPMVVEPEVMPSQKMPIQESVAEQKRYVPQLSSEQEALYAEAKRLGISSYELERRGWKYNPNQPTIQVVPASPMQMQNPMTPPGMRTVVIQPMKEPGQEMIEEALRLKELARRQAHFNGFHRSHNPEPWNYNQSSYSPSPSLHLVDGNPYDPNPEAFNSRKSLASQWNVYGPSSSQQAMESREWLMKQGFATYEDYLAQKKRA